MATIQFGTDGVRGRAYEDLSLADAFLIGRAAADVFGGTTAVIGRDTRESGPALTAALAAGLAAGGIEALDLGVAPTPAVAFVAGQRGAVGAVVSASHNPWFDNGIKLFSPQGSKLGDADQAAVEARLGQLDPSLAIVEPSQTIASIQSEVGGWVQAVRSSIDVDLTGIHVVVDCAHGAASHVVAPALADLGAQVTPMFNQPDGRNINEACGSTYPQSLAKAVVDADADIGLALDGDADRLLAVDHMGTVIDGDQIMAMLALDMDQRGLLAGSQLVVTVMSNLGLLRSMDAAGISFEVTPVGDRNVLIALDRLGANLGGEQSGHLIFTDHGGTGDGFLSGVQLLGLLKRSSRTIRDLAASSMVVFPQVLQNVRVTQPMPDIADRISREIAQAEAALGEQGRVLVRASGTEPVIRVMVEAADQATAQQTCDGLCAAVEALV
ncbi:phosphoglucosamine mutase [Acidimicrobiales bacterium]|nr:phosphoglucosamine mutase [Acidimicrobiales bacterium]MDC1389118.1 phosphoglucosamine mutase [Acidimicrobiales bacterium]MDG1086896.1 phosphoglucosamine mutase [Acidimicrobiales bacterium]